MTNYIPIRPQDTSRPCPLATLPPELRWQIYQYACCFEPIKFKTYKSRRLWPALLRTSRAVRIELAHIFYTEANFKAVIARLDFREASCWVESLPARHLAYLSKNQNLHIEIAVRPQTVIPSSHIRAEAEGWCSRFADWSDLQAESFLVRRDFAHFCRLAEWWLWCNESNHRDLRWHYDIAFSLSRNPYFYKVSLGQFVRRCLCLVTNESVQKYWVKEKEKRKMKKEALNLLSEIEQAVENFHGRKPLPDCDDEQMLQFAAVEKLYVKINHTRKFMEEW